MAAALTGSGHDGSIEDVSLEHLRGVFENSFESQNWPQMVQVLEQLIEQGEDEGLIDLCLRAQALRNLVLDLKPELKPGLSVERQGHPVVPNSGPNSSEDAEFLKSVGPVFEQTRFYLSHFHWSNHISH